MKTCKRPGCPNQARRGCEYCEEHKRQNMAVKPKPQYYRCLVWHDLYRPNQIYTGAQVREDAKKKLVDMAHFVPARIEETRKSKPRELAW